MNSQYTLKIYPWGKDREVYRVIEIWGRDILDQLCAAILDTYDFQKTSARILQPDVQ